jgi:hypothetical protein
MQVRQPWRAVAGGFVVEVISQAPIGWHLRFDRSGRMIIVDDGLLVPTLYERTAMRE